MDFFVSKVAMVIYGALAGAATTLAGQKVYKVVTEPKPYVFDHRAVSKLPESAQKQLRDLASDAGLQT